MCMRTLYLRSLLATVSIAFCTITVPDKSGSVRMRPFDAECLHIPSNVSVARLRQLCVHGQLDEPQRIRVNVPLMSADAWKVVQILQRVFSDEESTLVFVADVASNSVLMAGETEKVIKIRALLNLLDAISNVINLKNGEKW